MLVANFTSRIPNMGESVAHVKFRELLESLRANILGEISSEVFTLKSL